MNADEQPVMDDLPDDLEQLGVYIRPHLDVAIAVWLSQVDLDHRDLRLILRAHLGEWSTVDSAVIDARVEQAIAEARAQAQKSEREDD